MMRKSDGSSGASHPGASPGSRSRERKADSSPELAKTASTHVPLDKAQTREERLIHAANRSGIGLWDLDLVSHSAERTLQHARIFGYESLDAGWSLERFFEHVLPEDRGGLDAALREAITNKSDWRYRCRIERRDGEIRWIEVSGGYVLDSKGRPVRMFGSVCDITERVAEERDRSERAEFLAAVFGDSPVALSIARYPDGTVFDVNQAFLDLIGYSRAEVIGRTAEELGLWVDADDRESALRALDEERGWAIVFPRLRRKDGGIRVLRVMAKRVTLAGQDCILSGQVDITEQREAEGALRESEQQFRAAIELAPGAIFVRQGDSFAYLNPAAVGLFGAESPERLLGTSVSGRYAPEEREKTKALMHELDRSGIPASGSKRTVLRLDGTSVRVIARSVPCTFKGQPSALVFLEDVSQILSLVEELRGSEERFQALMDAAPDGVMLQKGGSVVYANEAMATMLGWERREDLLGLSWLPMVAEEYRESVLQITGSDYSVGTRVPAFDLELLRRDRSRIVVEVSAVITTYEDERTALVFVRDRTDQRRAEAERRALQEQLFQSQKMESMGILASGVAHDFNNILMVQRGYCDIVRTKLRRNDPLRSDFDEISACIDRATSLTGQLLTFTRKQKLSLEVVDLNDLVRRLAGMLERLIGEHVTLAVIEAPHPATVVADPSQLEQVLVNLAVNARDAMPNGGTLEIEVSAVDSEDIGGTCPRCFKEIPVGRYVVVRVTDSGVGMDESLQRRVFEPFFTTKGEGKGTGLGLSTVYGTVSQSGGHVWLESEVGKGTTFWVVLPYAGREVDVHGVEGGGAGDKEPHKPATERRPGGGGGRSGLSVLLVEDEPILRKLISSMLKELDNEVSEAANGQEALALVRDRGLRPDIILTDLVLPDVNGREVADRLHAIVPRARVIYVSGYSDDAITGKNAGTGAILLQKPFSLSNLRTKLEEASRS